MYCLTLWQPWASLVAEGEKRFETRSWAHGLPAGTLLAIHAAKKLAYDALTEADIMPDDETAYAMMYALGMSAKELAGELPRGAVLAIVRTGFQVETDSVRGPAAFRGALISETEELFGDYSPGRWAWELEVVMRLTEPIPAKGGQRIWNWDAPEWLVRTLAAGAEGGDT